MPHFYLHDVLVEGIIMLLKMMKSGIFEYKDGINQEELVVRSHE